MSDSDRVTKVICPAALEQTARELFPGVEIVVDAKMERGTWSIETTKKGGSVHLLTKPGTEESGAAAALALKAARGGPAGE